MSPLKMWTWYQWGFFSVRGIEQLHFLSFLCIYKTCMVKSFCLSLISLCIRGLLQICLKSSRSITVSCTNKLWGIVSITDSWYISVGITYPNLSCSRGVGSAHWLYQCCPLTLLETLELFGTLKEVLKTWAHLCSNITEEYSKWLRNFFLGCIDNLAVPSQLSCERHCRKAMSKCLWKEFVIVLLGTLNVQGLCKRYINTAAGQCVGTGKLGSNLNNKWIFLILSDLEKKVILYILLMQLSDLGKKSHSLHIINAKLFSYFVDLHQIIYQHSSFLP